MVNLLLRYLQASKYRSIIEIPRDPNLQHWGTKLVTDVVQAQQNLSIEKTYCLAWMIVNKRETISLGDVVKIRQLRNLQKLDGAKKIKKYIYSCPGKVKRERQISAEELILSVEDTDRFHSIFQRDAVENPWTLISSNPDAARRGFWAARIDDFKKIHEKHIALFRAYPEKGENKLRAVMTFEVDHLTVLRLESFLQRDFEILYKQKDNVNWPPTQGKNNLKFGWVMFLPQIDGSIRIDEIQSPIEEPLKDVKEAGSRMIRPPAFTGFMLQQFLQHFILRGVTRFTIPTLETRKAMTEEGLTTLESNYRELPKAFGFEKNGSFWVLDFDQR